jgi:hypothetical protein
VGLVLVARLLKAHLITMLDSARFYDRALRRLSRRELLNVAWKLGATAIAQSLCSDLQPRRGPFHSRRRQIRNG